ncbi:pollen-specific leucine-rich repeat extensin-like protein 2 isoform X2 [Solanum dulcamara]|uniref:pollen-specific leucine-rich repeat extensin-like protein 2 isoform X2 n=1 Tax=Solanum dulcamara TaxID=45834 RepID=UPI0024860623|nr:pollen-specific leucine-rich repeat extensin-like protein 2 isoform X2 [Solanum dulcamara]
MFQLLQKEIRDQIYDEKCNTVTITVVCCNPEKLRDKLCCKGCGVIKSIEIKDPPKPKPPEKPKQPEKPKEPEKPKAPEKPKEPEKPKAPEKPKEVEKHKPKEPEKPKEPPKPKPVCPTPMPIQEYPQQPPHGYCCGQCYEGHTGGPCYQLYGRPVPPPPCSGNYGYCYGPGPGCGCGCRCGPYGYRRGCCVSRCDQYFNDENATGCSIM